MIIMARRRIHGHAEEFFIPEDFEVSHEELMFLSHAATTWRGINGEVRRLAVTKYVEKDPYDPDFEEDVVHYALYELSQDGQKTMYRQFLVLASGAIIEIFDQFLGTLFMQFLPCRISLFFPTYFYFVFDFYYLR
jgi:hypothetical protein